MEFYKLWKTRGGLIGVNKLTLGDLIRIQFVLLLLVMILVAVAIAFVPMILFGLYVILMLSLDGGDESVRLRLWVNVLTVVTTIYFLLDFHLGWYSHSILASSMYADTYDGIAINNVSVSLMSIATFFIGHEIYQASENRLVRVITLLIFLFFGFKFTNKISTAIVSDVFTQYTDTELEQERYDLKIWDEQNTTTEEERLQKKIDKLEKEKKKEQELKDFDKNFAKDYL